MGFMVRNADLRHELHVLPPIEAEAGADPEREVVRLTAAHVQVLEGWIRDHPEHWFWVHRRWKTAPPASAS
jgi:KDO2-lipid IV(A) lauroyltransferase